MGAPGLGRSFQAGELHLVSLKCQNQIRCQITLKSVLCCVPGHCLEKEKHGSRIFTENGILYVDYL